MTAMMAGGEEELIGRPASSRLVTIASSRYASAGGRSGRNRCLGTACSAAATRSLRIRVAATTWSASPSRSLASSSATPAPHPERGRAQRGKRDQAGQHEDVPGQELQAVPVELVVPGLV